MAGKLRHGRGNAPHGASADAPTPSAGASGYGPASPPAQRLSGASWLNLRMVAGVLLVVICVLVGARVVSAAGAGARVWAATADLSAGTRLAAADVRVATVKLDRGAGNYLAATTSPVGLILSRDVAASELLPAAAVKGKPTGAVVSLPVAVQHAPAGLRAGARVDVYASITQPGQTSTTTLVASAVPVQQVVPPAGGLLSSGATLTVVVSVAPDTAGTLVQAVRSAELDLVTAPGPDPRPTQPLPRGSGGADADAASPAATPDATQPSPGDTSGARPDSGERSGGGGSGGGDPGPDGSGGGSDSAASGGGSGPDRSAIR